MSSLFKALGAVLCLIFALSFAAPNAHADSFTYTYTGVNFATVVSPYTTSDGVDGIFVLSAALPSNSLLTDESALLVSYSFTDGVQTLTNLNSTVQFFQFATSGGAITLWEFAVVSGTQEIATFVPGNNINGEFGGSTVIGAPHGSTFGVGSWSGPVVGTVPTPEPSSFALMLSGVGLLFAMRKRWGSGLQQA